ncbi:Peptidoglycan/LPS O-acetylase OafA/YrhL, contains acyltransferase and SGNH-hydrolase domains [Duganella sp. CF402]|uniref:acyltransferase family protein n=1 Tax=unclassified Duganella TaxID=2636909 RepID=UPI0008C68FED|nr:MULTISPECIES: acyltransferase family protein [unclassified Duganella]RZT09736.1 peptidoglycan/LPS O-acetylase OafA/YrhL [Duganella sp. BK701]SEL45022.1 Peptidoglycan/LPS O-acetylase OafA/YrhL, contains acyltransferase and SGNH-hydrolase domains [Duganella sp. CF402]
MNRSFSIYLDLVRVLSALAVVLYHSNLRLLSTDKLPFSNHGHAAVIVFFVLSGYVISHITATRENTPLEYWSSRLARFYSLALPVVLLTPLLDQLGEAMAPQFYDGRTTHDLAWLRIITSLAFLNEAWTLSIMSFSNVPYWSLCYEFWYYVLFAILTFTRGRKRVLWCGAVMLLIGPNILLLAPVWATGVVLHRWAALQRMGRTGGLALLLASCAAYGAFHHAGLTEAGSAWLRQLIGTHWHQQLAFSRYLVTDYLLALIVAAHFVGVRALAGALPLERIASPVRATAAYTFSIYLLHQPLIQFYAALFNGDPSGPGYYLVTMLAVFSSIFVIGAVTEQQRHHWRRAIHGWLASPAPQPLPAVVLGIDTPIGLAIIRDLGRHGVTVYGIARSEGALGLSSRYLHRGMQRADDVVAQLRRLGDEIGPAALFAIAETDILALNKARVQLPGYRFMFADRERMERVLRKDLTYAAAAQAGVFVPRTWHPASIDDGATAAAQARFPVVLKWADPNAMIPLLRQAGMRLEKAQYCDDADTLMAALRRYQVLARFPMVQEYCAGYGLGQFVLMKDGQALYRFQHQRLHEWPPEGGTSTLCVSLPASRHVELMRQSVALLRALEWEGVAMVEYRYDSSTGRAALMEVNGRFWGSLPLACQAGANFPWYCYQALALQEQVAGTAYEEGVRCRYMTAETRRLLHVRTWRELAGYLTEFLRPRSGYFVHDWRDPLPLWRDLRHSVLQRLPQRVRQKRYPAKAK